MSLGQSGGGGFGEDGGIRVPVGRGGGGGRLSLSGIIILVIVFFVLRFAGIDPTQLLGDQGNGSYSGGQTADGGAPATSCGQGDDQCQFVATVLAETEDVWHGIFQANGAQYVEPKLVLYRDQLPSACGLASLAVGPFYCPGDQKIYLDLGFFDQLASQFGASGDFAQAYVIAHEVGHHVQDLMGTLGKIDAKEASLNQADRNKLSVRIELQADCYAGIWAHFTDQKGLLENGDIEEALNAAQKIGDDTLEKESQGYVVPDSFTHGTSAQRVKWLKRGMQNGRMDDCDTFSGSP